MINKFLCLPKKKNRTENIEITKDTWGMREDRTKNPQIPSGNSGAPNDGALVQLNQLGPARLVESHPQLRSPSLLLPLPYTWSYHAVVVVRRRSGSSYRWRWRLRRPLRAAPPGGPGRWGGLFAHNSLKKPFLRCNRGRYPPPPTRGCYPRRSPLANRMGNRFSCMNWIWACGYGN